MCVCVHNYVNVNCCDKVMGISSSTSMKVPLINQSTDGDNSVGHITMQEETESTCFVVIYMPQIVMLS